MATPLSTPVRGRTSHCLFLVCATLCSALLFAAEPNERRQFSLPPGSAAQTLMQFAEQSGRGVAFVSGVVQNIETKTVQGELSPAEALRRMLAGTGLVAEEDAKTGAFAVRKGPADPNAGRVGRVAAPASRPNQNQNSNRDTSEDSDDQITTLSPFVVNTTQDTGYLATSTLAGTRLNTPIKDLSVAVSIYTKDFLDDIGATGTSDLLIYATGMEAAGAGGNFSGVGNDINDPRPAGNGPRTNSQTSRSRGLSSPTYTRGYFATSIPNDSYNTGTVTVNRGPNAALFGVGSPAGVVDTALLQPEFSRNRNTAVFRYGNNHSVRGSLDLNRVMIKDKLAFRIAALADREEYNQRPAFEEKKRIYGAINFKPFTSTSLRANFESGNTRANRPISFLPHNSVPDQWFAAGRPSYDWRFYDDPVLNPSATNHGVGTEGFLNANTQTGTQPIIVYNNANASRPAFGFLGTTPSTATNAANAVKNQILHPIANRNLLADSIRFLHTPNILEIAAGFWTGDNVPPGQQPGFVPAGIKAQGFTNYDAFDFKNRMLDETSYQGDSFRAVEVTLEQTFWRNQAGIEFAYNKQRYDNSSKNSFFSMSNNSHIYLDTTVTLPNGQPNPNLGRPFAVYGQSNWNDSFQERDAWHATAFLKYDFKDLSRSWGKWLGRHTLTGLYEDSRINTLAYRVPTAVLGTAAEVLGGTSALNTLARRPATLVYMGPSLIGNNNPLTLEAIRIPEINAGPTANITYFSRAADAIDPGQFVDAAASIVEIAGPGSAGREVIKSQAVVLQSYWLSENLITTLSWRRDEDYFANQSINFSPNPADVNDPGQARFSFKDFPDIFRRSPPPQLAKEIKSYGGVLRWPREFARLPRGTEVSVFVNRSGNFTPAGGRVNNFGEARPSPEGKTDEYGFNFSALSNRLTLRVNWFKTSIQYANDTPSNYTVATVSSILATAAAWAREGNANPHLAAQRNADIELLFSPLPANYRELYNYSVSGSPPNIAVTGNLSLSLSGAGDTTDYVAKGTEMDLVFNPTRNWRILLNVAKQETVKSNSYPFTKRFVELMKPVWDQLGHTPRGNYPVGYQPGTPLPANVQTYSQWLDANVHVPLATALATEGSVSAEQRKWRANLISNYNFGADSVPGLNLKGWGVGGAIRWQDKYALGYPTTRDHDGGVTIDIANPFFAPDNTNIDLWVSYERMIWKDRARWKLQLNVRNAFGSTDPVPVHVQPWGEIATARIAPERRWYLTSTFTF